jgi:hypothetical protein
MRSGRVSRSTSPTFFCENHQLTVGTKAHREVANRRIWPHAGTFAKFIESSHHRAWPDDYSAETCSTQDASSFRNDAATDCCAIGNKRIGHDHGAIHHRTGLHNGAGSNNPCIVAKSLQKGSRIVKTTDMFGNEVVQGRVQFHAPKSAGVFVYRIFDNSSRERAMVTHGTSVSLLSSWPTSTLR